MLILRKIGEQSNSRTVIADPLVGVANGVNQVFTVSNEYTSSRIEIVYNGQVLKSSRDFEETGPDEITLIFLKPEDLSLYSANYEISA